MQSYCHQVALMVQGPLVVQKAFQVQVLLKVRKVFHALGPLKVQKAFHHNQVLLLGRNLGPLRLIKHQPIRLTLHQVHRPV